MPLTLGNIFYVTLLFTNAIAILNEERFLARIGWTAQHAAYGNQAVYGDPYAQEGPGIKARLINLIGAVRTLMRIPLIILNTFIILYELLLG